MVIFEDGEAARLTQVAIERARHRSGHRPEFKFTAPRANAELFYSFFVKLLGEHDGGTLQDALVRIDGSGDREFRRALSTYLRREIPPGKVREFRMSDSKKDPLIQLADMCVGAIARSYRGDDRTDANRWRSMLSKRIANVWEFR